MIGRCCCNQAQGRCLSINSSIFVLMLIVLCLELIVVRGQDEITQKIAIVGHNVTLSCNSMSPDAVWWTKNGHNISTMAASKRYLTSKQLVQISDEDDAENEEQDVVNVYQHLLNITNVHLKDTGNFSCHKRVGEEEILQEHFHVQSIILAKLKGHSGREIRTKISTSVQLFCLFEASPLDEYKKSIKWFKDNVVVYNSETVTGHQLQNRTQIHLVNETYVNVTLDVTDVSKKDNGSYACSMTSPFDDTKTERYDSSLLVLDVPQVSIDYVKAVGASKIYLNWTCNDGNDPVTQYFVQHMKEGSAGYTYYNHAIDGKNVSYVLESFEPNSSYQIKIMAKNNIGTSPAYTYPHPVRTLEKDPVFIPNIEVTGSSYTTMTISWQPPPTEMLDFIHCYELIVAESGANSTIIAETVYPENNRNLPYMFDNLRTATEYKFKVRSCSELTKLCGNWSEIVTGTTMDGQATEPLNLKMSCSYYNISGRTIVSATWEPPAIPNGKITSYHIVLDGLSTFRSDSGLLKNETYGPKVKYIDEKTQKADYENVPANTNYTVRVSGVTRNKKAGIAASATCQMPPTTPDLIGRILWGKVKTETDDWIFKLILPRISERNGPICGYRIYLVRIGAQQTKHLPAPEDMDVMTYHEVHSPNNTRGGAYIAEILSNNNFHSEIFLGDGQRIVQNESVIAEQQNAACRKILNGYYAKPIRIRPTKPPPTDTDDGDDTADPVPAIPLQPGTLTQKERLDRAGNLTSEASKILNSKNRRRRRRRQHSDNSIPNEEEQKTSTTAVPTVAASVSTVAGGEAFILTSTPPSISINTNSFEIFDGQLDPNSNYTGFVEVIVKVDDEDKTISTYSEYFETKPGGPIYYEQMSMRNSLLNTVTQVFCALILLVLVLLIALYFWQRFSKNAAQGDEVISLRDSLSRALCGGRNTHNHRHLIGSSTSKPADIGPILRTELPQAYVQRHKDTDYGFLREYEMLPNRFNDRTTKHSDAKENVFKNRYPDIKAYDQTRVRLAEKNATIGSDYINGNFVLGYKERKKFICAQGPMDSTVSDFWRMIWEQHLEIIVMLTNLEEYNKAKCAKYWPEKVDDSTKFGEITVTFLEETRYSDYLVRELKVTKRILNNGNSGGLGGEEEEERRHITQYHYLVWKDFMAPEHPHGIIKFIRQINSVYSLQRGPILVHCSAGVGRTGTLVALDSLMQQLDDEGQVSIFNTVCDMRHQRNFLVQSLKQYIFLYRALLDIAQYGNTELPVKGLSAAVESLKTRLTDSTEKCKLEIEFERIKSITDDTNKTCTFGSGEEHVSKNRSKLVIPFDRNRVILTPIPGRDHSTYINASFIEGYDNSESFIITQDPLEETIPDFWRMISEQGINTIVMISEIGDGPKKCPRYWADDEIQYDHILVKYMQSESCPYYTRREFNVTNCKMKDTIKVTQFQYNGWPTVEGEVPEVARGMIELVDQAQNHHNSQATYASIGPIAVHCNTGTERSSIYVAMCILVQLVRTEKKVDICTTTRKLRSQRNMLLDSYAQYEFLHRAIVNYADLHNLAVDSSSEC